MNEERYDLEPDASCMETEPPEQEIAYRDVNGEPIGVGDLVLFGDTSHSFRGELVKAVAIVTGFTDFDVDDSDDYRPQQINPSVELLFADGETEQAISYVAGSTMTEIVLAFDDVRKLIPSQEEGEDDGSQ